MWMTSWGTVSYYVNDSPVLTMYLKLNLKGFCGKGWRVEFPLLKQISVWLSSDCASEWELYITSLYFIFEPHVMIVLLIWLFLKHLLLLCSLKPGLKSNETGLLLTQHVMAEVWSTLMFLCEGPRNIGWTTLGRIPGLSSAISGLQQQPEQKIVIAIGDRKSP